MAPESGTHSAKTQAMIGRLSPSVLTTNFFGLGSLRAGAAGLGGEDQGQQREDQTQ